MKHYVGLDVSLNETAICVVNEDGTIVREGKTLSEPEAWCLARRTWLAFRQDRT
jgi:predicted NBD/HSP70 family sugar kinase